jgi:hypothetical protein
MYIMPPVSYQPEDGFLCESQHVALKSYDMLEEFSYDRRPLSSEL